MPQVKNGEERVVVLNRVATSVIKGQRGLHSEYVFPYRGHRVTRMYNSVWKRARIKAAEKYMKVLSTSRILVCGIPHQHAIARIVPRSPCLCLRSRLCLLLVIHICHIPAPLSQVRYQYQMGGYNSLPQPLLIFQPRHGCCLWLAGCKRIRRHRERVQAGAPSMKSMAQPAFHRRVEIGRFWVARRGTKS